MVRYAVAIAFALLTMAPVPSAAGAERQCASAECVTIAWPDRSVDLRSSAALELRVADGTLTESEGTSAIRLAERRLSLRIRGLELRYLVGKTATAGGDTVALESIRHRIEAIDLEIAFIDQELAGVLDAASRRTGPWLVRTEVGALWLVTPRPCRKAMSLAVTDAAGSWREVEARLEPNPPEADLPSDCPPLRLTAAGRSLVRLKLDGEAIDFRFAE
jgi:hypothetical protein